MDSDIPFRVVRTSEGGAVVVVPEGEIDIATVDSVRAAVQSAQRDESRVVIDLRGVTFLDSSGLRLLVESQHAADRAGGSLVVVRGSAHVQRLLDIAGISARLTLVDDPADGLRDDGVEPA